MLEIAAAELSHAASNMLGRRFSPRALLRLLHAIDESQRFSNANEAGTLELLKPIRLDDETRREVLLRRFRLQAARAARETVYYRDMFARLGLNPARLRWEDIAQIPLTPKEGLRDWPYDFVARNAKPFLRTTTTGTTGKPTSICFSVYELEISMLLLAIAVLNSREVIPEDIVAICNSSRANSGNFTGVGACALVNCLTYQTGIVDPALTLAMLAEEHFHLGKRQRTTLIGGIYPSYLGELVETGLRLGYRPADFALRRIDIGSEILTDGLKARTEQVFGPVPFDESYGMVETWPLGAGVCPEGHLHFSTTQGLVEFINPETGAPAQPGEIATIVATPLLPYRETTLLLRYDTQDVVRLLPEPPACALRHMPATSKLLGKLRLSVRHEHGWTFPRDVLEALEACEPVPLPARCSFWSVPGGLAVEVVVRGDPAAAKREVERSLEGHGVPIQELHLREDRSQLQHPFPLRCDLKEVSFSPPPKR